MIQCKPVCIKRNAFLFCKYTIAVMLWAALFLKLPWMLIIITALLGLSAIVKVRRSPLVWIYTATIEKLRSSEDEIVDENGMRFAHTLGTVLNLVCVILLYFVNPTAGWVMVAITAIAKTAGAMGYCSALKLYGCMSSGGCCRITRSRNA